jgi:hypothetical protein
MRLATLKYLTRGSSGVCGLNTSFRYDEVRLAYAGESTIPRRRVANEEGSWEREKEESFALGAEGSDLEGGKSVVAGEGFSSINWLVAERERNSSLLSLPSPIFSYTPF